MLLPPGFINSDGEYTLEECPLCGKDNHFNWNLTGEYGHCWVCDGTITGYFNLIQAAPNVREVEVKVRHKYGRGYRSQRERGENHYINAWDSPAREYLESRNITEMLSYEVPFMYDSSSGVVSVRLDPSSDELPPLSMYRWPNEDSKWLVGTGGRREHYAFNLNRFRGSRKTILVCEGLFDVVSSGFLNYGVSLCGSKISDSLVRWMFNNISGVVLWLDDDVAGWLGNESIKKKLEVYGIPCHVMKTKKPPKDFRWSEPEDREILLELRSRLK